MTRVFGRVLWWVGWKVGWKAFDWACLSDRKWADWLAGLTACKKVSCSERCWGALKDRTKEHSMAGPKGMSSDELSDSSEMSSGHRKVSMKVETTEVYSVDQLACHLEPTMVYVKACYLVDCWAELTVYH